MPARIFLAEKAGGPEHSEDVTENERDKNTEAPKFFARRHSPQIFGTREPDVAPNARGGDRFDSKLGKEQIHPVSAEFWRSSVEAGTPGIGLLVQSCRDHQETTHPANQDDQRRTYPAIIVGANSQRTRMRRLAELRRVQYGCHGN